ncbi:MAG: hypothetical protein HY848_03395 [Betaproteobacteria bacterium]|nr:hypothetical protein [Betaproteobacteria bacterium]
MILLAIVVVLCGPFTVMALLPAWSWLIGLVGVQESVQVENVDVIFEPKAHDEPHGQAFYRVFVNIRTQHGLVKYSVRRVLSGDTRQELLDTIGRSVSCSYMPFLAQRFGWNPWTVRIRCGLMRSGVLMLLLFWLLGALPLSAVVVYVATGEQIIFKLLQLLGVP